MTDYSEAMEFLDSFSKKGEAVKDLSRFNGLMKNLGNPQDSLKFIHVAGTNGKGSVTEYCSSVLINKGYKVGQYTSPYIICYEDRIRINGQMISKSDVLKYMNKVSKVVGDNRSYSQFEITTAVMFLYFAEQNCDIVCLETGVGGLLDATNIIKNTLVSVITSISLDHTAILGNTIEKIAYQKAGIIKPDSKVILSADNGKNVLNIVKKVSDKAGSNLTWPDLNDIENISYKNNKMNFCYKGEEYLISMLGNFQIINAVTSIEVLESLDGFNITASDIKSGLKLAKVPSRFEIIRDEPLLILDGAHNPAGTKALADAVGKIYCDRKFTVICGMLTEKDCANNVENISCFADFVYVAEGFTDKTEGAKELSYMFNERGITSSVITSEKIEEFLDRTEEDVIVCGSLYLTSYVRSRVV